MCVFRRSVPTFFLVPNKFVACVRTLDGCGVVRVLVCVCVVLCVVCVFSVPFVSVPLLLSCTAAVMYSTKAHVR